MAYNDLLFRLGVELSDGENTLEKKDHFIEKDGIRYAGNHLIIDVHSGKRLDDIEHVKSVLGKCVESAGASVLHIHLHHFTPNGGISGVAVLAESHISIHTWPEANYAAIDVFTCGNARPELCIPVLKAEFQTNKVYVQYIMRGVGLDDKDWKAGVC